VQYLGRGVDKVCEGEGWGCEVNLC
jgi:hypothetical protein